jgi:hypothetical protein
MARLMTETFAQILARYGEQLFGEEWAAPLARLTGANERTVRRVRQAAREGLEYPAARGLLAALGEAVRPIASELERYLR